MTIYYSVNRLREVYADYDCCCRPAPGCLRAREQGWSLKPADAIHLATAEQMAVDEFHTYEKIKLDKFGPICGFSVREPLAQQPQLPTQGDNPESR